jgi:hypothetical protein
VTSTIQTSFFGKASASCRVPIRLCKLGGSPPRGALELHSDPALGPPPFPRSRAGPAALRADMGGLKNIIPPRHADPEATRRIAEMMQHVETPESQAQTGLGLAMMHVVMHHVIGKIADDKTHQHRIPKGRAEQKPHDGIGKQHDRSAEQHRHDEAQWIVGMHVMDAMDQEMNFGAQTAGKRVMEQQAVAEIFDQSPNKITKRRGAKDGPGIVSFQTQAREDENQRQIN